MPDRYFDLDSFLAEAVQEAPVRVRLLGQTWQLPASVPMGKMARYLRARVLANELAARDPEERLTDEEADRIRDVLELDIEAELRDIAGDDTVNAWVAHEDMTLPKLTTLFWRIVRIYEGAAREDSEQAEGDEQGEAKGPQPGPNPPSASPPSSSNGQPSKQTSSVNTGST